jgi:hypothetical protein
VPRRHRGPEHHHAFFELFRWDFVLDEQGQPHLMEINM